jgi:hypothetical protein
MNALDRCSSRLRHGFALRRAAVAVVAGGAATMSDRRLPEPEDAFDEKLVADVREHGWHCVLVEDDHEQQGHPFYDAAFAYTVGLTHTYGHPELVLVGRWQHAHGILGAAVDLVHEGARLAVGDESDEVLEGYPVRFGAVSEERRLELLTYAVWLSGGRPFAALQVILPDGGGRMPDDPGYEGYPQPLLAG